jgi:hypothetical protein
MNPLRSEASGTRGPLHPFNAWSPHGIDVANVLPSKQLPIVPSPAAARSARPESSTTLSRITLPVAGQ